MNARQLFLVVLLLVFTRELWAEVYKYKDQNGKWVFSDKKPSSRQSVEKIKLRSTGPSTPKRPEVFVQKDSGGYSLIAHNPYFAPIELKVESPIFERGYLRRVITPAGNTTLYTSGSKIPDVTYYWSLGDPKARPDGVAYQIPIASKQQHRITQSFKGKFSHSKRPSLYAVDIAMQVGTYLAAARGGTVIGVKDDYHMGGSKTYFLDKANYIKVLHDDGTYALYAHILQGSALVKPGDKVQTGARLARSGSSGFSTGPHLHFVIRRNAGLKTVSVPFEFVDSQGKRFIPRRGLKVAGVGAL